MNSKLNDLQHKHLLLYSGSPECAIEVHTRLMQNLVVLGILPEGLKSETDILCIDVNANVFPGSLRHEWTRTGNIKSYFSTPSGE